MLRSKVWDVSFVRLGKVPMLFLRYGYLNTIDNLRAILLVQFTIFIYINVPVYGTFHDHPKADQEAECLQIIVYLHSYFCAHFHSYCLDKDTRQKFFLKKVQKALYYLSQWHHLTKTVLIPLWNQAGGGEHPQKLKAEKPVCPTPLGFKIRNFWLGLWVVDL